MSQGLHGVVGLWGMVELGDLMVWGRARQWLSQDLEVDFGGMVADSQARRGGGDKPGCLKKNQ